jgi:hypothetical protein
MKHLYTLALVVFSLGVIYVWQLMYVVPLLTLPETKSNTPTLHRMQHGGYNQQQMNRMILKESIKKRVQKNYKGIVS